MIKSKPTHYYLESKINFSSIRVEFHVTGRMLEVAALELADLNEVITKKSIEEKVRSSLTTGGLMHIDYFEEETRIYDEEGKKKIDEAKTKVRTLFPEYFTHEK